jgi:transposase
VNKKYKGLRKPPDSFLQFVMNKKQTNMKTYPADLTESQWQVIENIVDPTQRKRKYSLHDIMNALLYIPKSGTQWRMLPKDFAPRESVYYYFRKWKRDGLIEETHDVLVERIRTRIGKKPTPSVGIIDSQSVKAGNVCEGDIGFDGGKKIKGRKRHIVVDTLGLIMIIVIHAANIHDSVGARAVMQLKSCPKDGLSNELFLGSRFTEGCPKIMKGCPNLVLHLSSTCPVLWPAKIYDL